jgi:DNA-binding NtrC family response regulator
VTSENPGGRNNDPANVNLPDLPPSGKDQTVILIADDEPQIRDAVSWLLEQDGHFVLSAADGHDGLTVSRQYSGSIDLLITDFDMPRLNGTDLCAHLLEERPGIKVLLISGAYSADIAKQNVTFPFLPKPFDAATLKARVRETLDAPGQPSLSSKCSDPPSWILRFKA